MKLLMCAVMDAKSGVMSQPQCFRTKGEALRSWLDALGDSRSNFCKHPEDYTFCQIGWFDDENGNVSSDVKPLMTAVESMAALSAAKSNSEVC